MINVNLTKTIRLKNFNAYKEEVSRINEMIEKKTGLGSDYLGWVDYADKITEFDIKRIQTVAKKIQKDCDTLVVIGIGGSYLGAKAAIDAIKGEFNDSPVKIIFIGHSLSPLYTAQVLDYLKDKKFAINVISKSGGTIEPAVAFRLVKELAIKVWGKTKYSKYIFATTDVKEGVLRAQAIKEGYECFFIPKDIGGRYSVFTPVGLLPMAVSGLDIVSFIKGVQEATREYANPVLEENQAYKYAVVRQMHLKNNKKVEFFITYEPHLRAFSEWWKQLFGESEGKNNSGILPASLNFTTDLHSMGQYCQEGSDIFFETTLAFGSYAQDVTIPKLLINLDNLNYLGNKTMGYLNDVAFHSTIEAHYSGNRSNVVIESDKMDEHRLGQLFYFFMKACAMSAYLQTINPFNQPGVEVYKKNMKDILKK